MLWSLGIIDRKIDHLGRPITRSGVSRLISAGGKFGANPIYRSDGSTGTISVPTGLQGPGAWSLCVLFEPPASGAAFCAGWKNTPGSTTQDRSIYVKTGRTVETYIFDGASKSIATANTVTAGINVAFARCDGVNLYIRLNDGAEASVAVANGGYAAYGGSAVIEGLIGPTTAGGGTNTAAAIGITAMAFYRRFLSNGEAVDLMKNLSRVNIIRRPDVTDISSPGAGGRRRQIIN